MSVDEPESRAPPRTLAGATILQIVPSLADEQAARNAVNVALALLRAGVRAMVVGASGPLVGELQALGGEWFELAGSSLNPLTLRHNAKTVEDLISSERIDLVHAHGISSARSAAAAVGKAGGWLVTSYYGAPPPRLSVRGFHSAALARGHRILAQSTYAANLIVERHRVPRERITIIPRSIDPGFLAVEVSTERIAIVRHSWRVRPGERVILAPGKVAPWKGQMTLVDAARILVNGGLRGTVFVIAGDDREQRDYVQAIGQRAAAQGVGPIVRRTGHCSDMQAAYAAADLVIVPQLKPTTFTRTAAEAQAMGRPVIVSEVGALPEIVLAPPRVADASRTGWLVNPGDPIELARAIAAALALDAGRLQALGARAHLLAELLFSPQRVAAATLAVYTSLLEGHV